MTIYIVPISILQTVFELKKKKKKKIEKKLVSGSILK